MNTRNNSILITGGGSGIGRGLAEAFFRAGNKVIIAGRRQSALDEVTAANPGMRSTTLNIEDPASIRDVAARLAKDEPALNVLINNAGVMRPEDLLGGTDTADAESAVTTNLLGPIRLTAALLPMLRAQPRAVIMNVTSGLAFVPLAGTPTYCATKAALHSYTQSLRYQLKGTAVQVLELIPPYVATTLMGEHQANDARAMPLDEFIAEVMSILESQPGETEICVERVLPLRRAASGEPGKYEQTFRDFNDAMTAEGHT